MNVAHPSMLMKECFRKSPTHHLSGAESQAQPYWPCEIRFHMQRVQTLTDYFDGLIHARRNSLANALELRLFGTILSIYRKHINRIKINNAATFFCSLRFHTSSQGVKRSLYWEQGQGIQCPNCSSLWSPEVSGVQQTERAGQSHLLRSIRTKATHWVKIAGSCENWWRLTPAVVLRHHAAIHRRTIFRCVCFCRATNRRRQFICIAVK